MNTLRKFSFAAATLVLAFLVLAFFITPAHAELNFDCLLDAEGRSLRWQADWQGDQRDDGVTYHIGEVRRTGRPRTTGVVLELAATGKAQRSVRHFPVDSEDFAKEICTKVFGPSLKPSEKSADASQKTTSTTTSTTTTTTVAQALKPMRFITYSGQSWVLADAPPTEPLSVCKVQEQQFLCRESEKIAHGAKLKDLEHELAVEEALPK